jgi:hypothetical protein
LLLFLLVAFCIIIAAVKVVLLLFASSSNAFFTGDNACASGEGAALGLKNWTGVKDVVPVPLSDSGVSLSVEGTLVDPDANDTVLVLYAVWFLGITCSSNKSFVGGLLRVSQQQGNNSTPVKPQLKKCQLKGILVSSSAEYPVVVDMTVVLSFDASSGRLAYTTPTAATAST